MDLFDIHNNFVEVAVGIGVFGLAGYLLVLYAFAKPLFGHGEYRRLGYVVWGYIGFGATVPEPLRPQRLGRRRAQRRGDDGARHASSRDVQRTPRTPAIPLPPTRGLPDLAPRGQRSTRNPTPTAS